MFLDQFKRSFFSLKRNGLFTITNREVEVLFIGIWDDFLPFPEISLRLDVNLTLKICVWKNEAGEMTIHFQNSFRHSFTSRNPSAPKLLTRKCFPRWSDIREKFSFHFSIFHLSPYDARRVHQFLSVINIISYMCQSFIYTHLPVGTSFVHSLDSDE